MTTEMMQEAVDLPILSKKYKYGLLRSSSHGDSATAALRRSRSFAGMAVNARSRRLHSDTTDTAGAGSSVGAQLLEEDVSQNNHNHTAPPSGLLDPQNSPGFSGQRSKSEGKLYSAQLDKNKEYAAKLAKRESLKVQKKHYRREKKRAAKELLSTLKDPSVVVMADWLKVRGMLKSWTRLWCVLKPGLLMLYKSHKAKSSHWVGTVLLNTSELIERPSKKDGFCFKLFHPLDQSIWATKGPKGENLGALTQPLPYSYLIFRAPSEAAGKCWMDALELALRCSNLLMKTMTRDSREVEAENVDCADESSMSHMDEFLSPMRPVMDESDCEKHFKIIDLDEDLKTDKEEEKEKSESETDHSEEEEEEEKVFDDDLQPIETQYEGDSFEELGQQGDACQTEEVEEENKSLIWSLVKQVRPGMDLSKVVLPTFILEPRSLLDKFADYYYHSDLLAEAVKIEDAFTRMKNVVRWYISGFYKKPKGLKKPYNPILGETFRCYWKNPKSGSRTFYVAEQISHHPPVSAFYVTNRQDGFSISGSVLAKSKFYGNSLSAIMDGGGRLTFLKRGEDYHITMPYAHCKGILIGTLTMELGGKVLIECEKTGYRTELEFKLKPFLGSGEASNRIVGKIKLGSETLATLDGHWDTDVSLKNKVTGEQEAFWSVTPDVKQQRLRRYKVPVEYQGEFEAERLWQHVSRAILAGDQQAATHEKFLLEEAQRRNARERKAKMDDYMPQYFDRNEITGDWVYKFADLRPWDPLNDLLQYEFDHIIQTKTRHRTPVVRTTSITNVDEANKRQTSMEISRAARIQRTSIKRLRSGGPESGSSTPDVEGSLQMESESSDSGECVTSRRNRRSLEAALDPLLKLQRETSVRLTVLQSKVAELQVMTAASTKRRSHFIPDNDDNSIWGMNRDVFLIAIILLFQTVLYIVFK